MNINSWIADRKIRGTLADVARRILASEKTYREAEERLRHFYILEALIRNEGNHEKTAEALGIHRHTIGRALKALRITRADVQKIAEFIKETK